MRLRVVEAKRIHQSVVIKMSNNPISLPRIDGTRKTAEESLGQQPFWQREVFSNLVTNENSRIDI